MFGPDPVSQIQIPIIFYFEPIFSVGSATNAAIGADAMVDSACSTDYILVCITFENAVNP